MKICKGWAVFALGAVAAWGQIPGFETNTYEVFTMPTSAFPSAINTPGTILSSGSGSGYLVRNGVITPFLVPVSDVGLVSPRGMNDNEDVVGEYQDSAGNAIAFAAIGGKFQLLTEPGGHRLEPRDINQNRTIVGTVTQSGALQAGFILKGGSYSFVNCTGSTGQPVGTVFSGINRNGAIAGWCLGGDSRGFVYQDGAFTFIQYPGSESTRIFDINSNGDLVGDARVRDSFGAKLIAFLYRKGTFYDVSFPGSRQTFAVSINDLGELLGRVTNVHRDANGTFLGFNVFNFVRGTSDLN